MDKKETADEILQVGFIGNPNCGKTTLFNAYTGAKLKVANWPGVTVEKKEGALKYHNHEYKLVDLPGIYSLTSYTMEETLSREYILSDDVDVIVDVADASCLERNLYLTLQLIELEKPVILALNMMDIVQERGMEIDLHRLPEMLGIPVIPVSARKRTGLDILMHAVAHHRKKITDKNYEHHHKNKKTQSMHKHTHHDEYVVVYSDEIEDKIDEITEGLSVKYGLSKHLRWTALKILEHDAQMMQKYPDFGDIADRSYESDIINQKYDFIEEVMEETVVNRDEKIRTTDRADKILTGNLTGLPVFMGIMAFVFLMTFVVGDILKGVFEIFLNNFSIEVETLLVKVHVNSVLTSLIVDGIIAGVGGILTFLPNIFMLFLALAILEDSGYMARAAVVMDHLMSRLGLSGRAFIPMLLGFGCSVPAIMASRALEDMRDRRKTILLTPFMSCSAKLPVYIVFSQIFFPKAAALVSFSMYLLGMILAVVTIKIVNLADRKVNENDLLIELPEYKKPNARTVGIYVWDKIRDYLAKAGTVIFLASIVLWFLLNFGVHGMITSQNVDHSFAAVIGKTISPILKPAGLGKWQVAVSLISGIGAKEIIITSFGILYGIGNVNSKGGMSQLGELLINDGFTTKNAVSLMVFSLLYTPCIAAVTTMIREFKSWKWSVAAITYQLVLAWGCATIAFLGLGLFL